MIVFYCVGLNNFATILPGLNVNIVLFSAVHFEGFLWGRLCITCS